MALVTLTQVRTPAHRGQAFECTQWQLERGQKWFICGANGSGKTMMARVLTGQQAVSRGEVLFTPGTNAAHDFAIVSFEEQQAQHALDDRFDDSELREDVDDPGTIVAQFLGRDECDPRHYQRWVQKLDIQALENRGIRRLSTGEMRKVLLVRALLKRSAVLILDDPLAGLDALTQSRFSTLLDSVFEQLDTVLVLSTKLNGLNSHFSHIAVLHEGRVELAEPMSDASMSEAQLILDRSALTTNSILGVEWPTIADASPAIPDTFIQIADVSVSFGAQKIFQNLDWTMKQGDHALICGPNGCGKSTLLAMLSGENPKAYGQNVRLFGHQKGSGESIWELRKYFGIVSTALQQKYAKGYRVMEVVLSGFQDSIGLYGESGDKEREVAKQWLTVVGMGQVSTQKFDSLSYGQQKLVLIARAMVKQPVLLVLDEPCIGLDQGNRQKVLNLVDEIAANSRTHLLFVSHVSDERPACINQKLEFVWNEPDQCYDIEVSRLKLVG